MRSVCVLWVGVAIVAELFVGASPAAAWNTTSYPGQDQLMTSTPLTLVWSFGSTPVMSITTDMDNDVTLDPGNANTGTVDTATLSNTTGSSGLHMVFTPDNLPWSITEDPSGGGGVIIDLGLILTVDSGGSIVGSATTDGSITGIWDDTSCTLTFTNAGGLAVTSASGALAGLNGLQAKVSGVIASATSPCPQLD